VALVVHQWRQRLKFFVHEVTLRVVDEPTGARPAQQPLHGWNDEGWRRRKQVVGIGSDVGGRGLILILSIDLCNNFWYSGDLRCHSGECYRGDIHWSGGVLWQGYNLWYGRNFFSGHKYPATWSWLSREWRRCAQW
jgi:hypothetical protein